jgi:hypothetical protein
MKGNKDNEKMVLVGTTSGVNHPHYKQINKKKTIKIST